jgi:hypothetical protein
VPNVTKYLELVDHVADRNYTDIQFSDFILLVKCTIAPQKVTRGTSDIPIRHTKNFSKENPMCYNLQTITLRSHTDKLKIDVAEILPTQLT